MTRPTLGRHIWNGIKLAIGITLAFPFLIFFLPFWYIYRWNEVREGRPAPVSLLSESRWVALFFKTARPPAPGFIIPEEYAEVGEISRRPTRSPFSASTQSNQTRESDNSDPSYSVQSDVSLPKSGDIALVTGGASPLGKAICQDLASLGYRVIITYYHSQAAAETLVTTLKSQGGEAQAFLLDQSDPLQITNLLQHIEKAWGVPDLLINNASLFLPTSLENSTWEGLEWLCRVNLQGPMWLAMRVGERMKSRASGRQSGGQIIQIGDIWGEQPLSGYAAYSVTKAGLMMATRALAREMAPVVRVNGIAPGAILPEKGQGPDANFQKMLNRTPLARHAGPEAMLQAIRYLLTAQFVTGEILHVDGGRRLV